jgi:hypothetical protein
MFAGVRLLAHERKFATVRRELMVDRNWVCWPLRPESGPAQLLWSTPGPPNAAAGCHSLAWRAFKEMTRPPFVVPYSETVASVWPDSGGICQTSGRKRQAQGVEPRYLGRPEAPGSIREIWWVPRQSADAEPDVYRPRRVSDFLEAIMKRSPCILHIVLLDNSGGATRPTRMCAHEA